MSIRSFLRDLFATPAPRITMRHGGVLQRRKQWVLCCDCGFSHAADAEVVPAILKWRPPCSICAGRNHAAGEPLGQRKGVSA